MAYRQERLEKIIERELNTILLTSAKDDRLRFVLVSKVSLTKDFSIATVYYRIQGTPEQIEATKKILEEAKGYLRTELSQRIDLRKTPELRFKEEHSIEYGERIESILKDIYKDQ